MLPPSSGLKSKPSRKQAKSNNAHVPPKRQLTFSGADGVMSQKIELSMITAVRTLHPACTLFCGLKLINVNANVADCSKPTKYGIRTKEPPARNQGKERD
jgi:hypothetical protein